MGYLDSHLIHDPWPTQVDVPNDITVCSATFEGLTIVTDRQTTLLRL